MRTMVAIDYFYHDDVRNILVAGDRGLVYLSDCSTDDLLTVLCESHGRSVNGSMELFAKINQAHQKLAVLVNPASQEIYFPTHASSNKACIWLNCGRIQRVEAVEKSHCMITFSDGSTFKVLCSSRVVVRQMKRCNKLLNSLCNPYDQINELFVQARG